MRLARIEGGNLRNAIPREAFGVVAVDDAKTADFVALVQEVAQTIKSELSATEPNLNVVVEETELPVQLIDEKTQQNLTQAVLACPNGVIRMSDSMKGLVETSTNLAIVKSNAENKTIEAGCLMRSSVDSAKEEFGRPD